MKRTLIIALATLVIVACKKKDKTGPEPDNLVGQWNLTEINFTGTAELAGTPITFSGEGSDYQGGYNLKADGTMSYDTKYTLNAEVPIVGTIPFPVDVQGSGTWKRVGNERIELTDENGIQNFPIKAEGPNVLILQQDTTLAAPGGSDARLKLEITLRR